MAEIRRAPLPFVLLGFTYAAYFLAGLIAFFAEGGVSESEEWRIFIVGWPTVSLAGPAAALLVAGLKRAHCAFPAPGTYDRNADAEPKEPHFSHK